MLDFSKQKNKTENGDFKENVRQHLTYKAGLSHDFVRQIESEKTRYNFSVESFYKISLALGVGMDALAREEEQEEQK